jgi:hypothetical protein
MVVGLLVAVGIAHFLQFLGMTYQVFASSKMRNRYPWFLGSLQAFFLLIVPVLIMVIQIFLLVFSHHAKHEVFYAWTIANLVINLMSIWSYITTIQNLSAEHAQSLVIY